MRRTRSAGFALSLAVAAAFVTPRGVLAQASESPVVIGTQTSVRSAILAEDRPVQIHLPRSYDAAGSARYPVLYVLDGDAHFAAVSAMTDFLALNGRMPETIVVAIPNTRDRTHDLTPAGDTGLVRLVVAPRDTITNRFPTAGGAARFRAFITDELARWVDARYRTVPYRILVGHSFGGLFVVDALATTPRAFNAYVAISPSLWWDGGRYVKRVETALAHASLDGRALYMTTGDREGPLMIDPARELAGALHAARPANFRSWYRVMPAETHTSNPLRTTYDALEHVFEGWETPDSVARATKTRGDLTGLDAHNAELTRRFGYPVTTSIEQVNAAGYVALQSGRIDAAVRLFRRNVASAPEVPNGWDSLADGLEAQGRLAEAVESQERAVRLGDAAHDPALPAFREHLARLRQLLVEERN